MRKIATFVVALMVAFGLAACGGSGEVGKPSKDYPSKEYTISDKLSVKIPTEMKAEFMEGVGVAAKPATGKWKVQIFAAKHENAAAAATWDASLAALTGMYGEPKKVKFIGKDAWLFEPAANRTYVVPIDDKTYLDFSIQDEGDASSRAKLMDEDLVKYIVSTITVK